MVMVIKRHLLLFFFLLSAFTKLYSQLCNGSLGDPIINITFGSGSNPGPSLATTTNLYYVPYDCPNDGSYTVRSNTSQCFTSSWHNLSSDHTGDANGYFMLINASLQKSEFYIDTVKGLCPGTTYEYAAWIINVLLTSACGGNGINPNLTFNIEKTDGTVLQTYSTGDITASAYPTWKQYGFFFTTPADAADVVVRISNNSFGGCGNDLAIDDITFRACGAKLAPFIIGAEGTLKDLCKGNNGNVTLSCDISAGYNSPSYQWQQSTDNGSTYADIPGANDITFIKNITAATPAGSYLYRIIVAEGANIHLPSCRVASGALTIRVNSMPVPTAASNSPVCEGTPLILSASGGSEYLWSNASAFSAAGASVTIKNAQPADSGKYYVSVISTAGCKQTDSTVVLVKAAPDAVTAFDNKTICQGDSLLLNSSGGTSYLWSPSAGLSSAVIANPVAKPADTTIYTILIYNEAGCKDSATVTINVSAAPRAKAGPDKNLAEGQSVPLSGSADGNNLSYTWFPGIFINDVHALQPVVNPANDITYHLTVSSNDGCGVSEDSVSIHVFKTVIIPNVFSPNADGINDTWNIKALNSYNDYELSVFNRYGRIVFTTRNYSNPWDGSFNGKPLPVGTYYYLLDLKQGLPKLKGFVVILR